MNRNNMFGLTLMLLPGLASPGLSAQAPEDVSYSPLALPAESKVLALDREIKDAERHRAIPLKVYLPADSDGPRPVVLFSHGLGGTRESCAYLGRHWAARGYLCVFLQHPGSDDSVWREALAPRRMQAMENAASIENFQLRVDDVVAVLDQLKEWNQDPEEGLSGMADLDRVGMSGHSFGSVTTQAVGGQRFMGGRKSFTDSRIKAAVMLSPSSPRRGGPKAAFDRVSIPWMLITGTHDTAPIGPTNIDSRLAVFPALPAGDKYELVLHEAEHSAFTERSLPGESLPRNPNHHRVILAVTTAFWDAFLGGDADAMHWLNGEGPETVFDSEDRWQFK